MLIQKVFHVRQSIDNARERLSDRRYFSDKFGGVFRCSHQLELLPTDDSDQVLFHSTGGEMELCGMMELPVEKLSSSVTHWNWREVHKVISSDRRDRCTPSMLATNRNPAT